MTRILFVNKSTIGEGTPTEEVLRLFEDSDDMEEIKAAVEGAAERLVATWASVEIKDNAGEVIPIEDIIEQQETLLERNGPISDEHSNQIIGQTIGFKVMENPTSNTIGVLHLSRIFDDYSIDQKVWDEIVSGERAGSSVGGYRMGVSQGFDEASGEQATFLEDFTHIETASVFDPCNPLALNEAFSVVAKSNSQKVREAFAGFDTLQECIDANEGIEEDPKGYCEMKREVIKTFEVQKPFLDFKDFADCVSQNQDKDDPEAFCGFLKERTEKEETAINKQANNDITKLDRKKTLTGETMKKNVLKTISEMASEIKKIAADVAQLKKQEPEEPDKPKEEEKQEEAEEVVVEEPEDVEEKKTKKEDEVEEEEAEKQDDEEDEDVEKEEAAGDIEGEEDATIPEPPKPEDSNEEDSFKNLEKKHSALVKKVAGLSTEVKKVLTPMPGAADVSKANKFAALPLEVAKGNKQMSMKQANIAYNKHLDNMGGGL